MRLLAQDPLRYRRQVLALKQFFSTAHVHRAAARRPDLGAGRPAAAQHRPRRDQPGAGDPAVRPESAAPARRQDARPEVPRRLPRLHPRHRARSPSSRAWSRASTARRSTTTRCRNGLAATRPDARRRPDARHAARCSLGPSGVGKTTTAVHCMLPRCSAASAATYYLFDEGLSTLLLRGRSSAWTSSRSSRRARATSSQIDPAELSPGEFASHVATPSSRAARRSS